MKLRAPVLIALVWAGCGGSTPAPPAPHLPPACPPLAARSTSPLAALAGAPSPPTGARVRLQVNQVGFPRRCDKQARLMSDHPLTGTAFSVVEADSGKTVFRAAVPAASAPFKPDWPYVYRLDFGALQLQGSYVLELGGVRSQRFRIGTARALYSPLLANSLAFFQAQRDGPDVIAGSLHRKPSHLLDRSATVYQTPLYNNDQLVGALTPTGTHVDASGGWFDAGDYLKFVETESFNDASLLFVLRQYPTAVPDQLSLRREARFGLNWLLKMWDPTRKVLYYQVGIGDGNGSSILGDHDLWRLPETDDKRQVKPGSPAYYETHRPVFAANAPGKPVSPNLAGRTAAAFGLCAQVFADSDPRFARRCLLAGQTLYDQADRSHGSAALVTTSPHDYYNQTDYHADLEFGAIELYLGTRRLGGRGMIHRLPFFYIPLAAQWANQYVENPDNGSDSLNLYDPAPFAHFDLVRALHRPEIADFTDIPGVNVQTDGTALTNDLRDQLNLATRLGMTNPFGLANPAGDADTVPHALGMAVEARLYDALTGTRTYEHLAEDQLDWVLGSNPWGSSFIAGAGGVYPHCLSHQIANLSGSLAGGAPILRGATVDGPNTLDTLGGLGAPDGYRPCPASGQDPFVALRGQNAGYLDDVRSSSTSEPSSDYAALAALALAQQAET